MAEDPELRRELEALNQAMSTAFERGDLRAVAAFYADDARIVGPGHDSVAGRAAIDAYWHRMQNPVTWTLDVHEVGGTRDDAYQLGTSALVRRGSDGQLRTSTVTFLVIWRRQPSGELKIWYDIYN